MTAVLRVKRKCTESPPDSLQLMFFSKRRRSDSGAILYIEPADTVAQFATTIKDRNEDVTQHLTKIVSSTDSAEDVRGTKRAADNDNTTDTSEKIAKVTNSEGLRDRYKVVGCQPLNVTNEEDKWTTLVDIEDCPSIHATDQDAKEEQAIEQYVYDLYLARTDNTLEEDEVEVYNTMYYQYNVRDQNNSDSECESDNVDSESHPRNNYPDTESDTAYGYNSESYGGESDDELFGLSETKYVGSIYNQYRNVMNYDSDSEREHETSDSDESFGIL